MQTLELTWLTEVASRLGDVPLALPSSPVELMVAAGLSPDPWQRELLESNAEQVVLNCSRQSGKSTCMAALALYGAMVQPRSLILAVAPSQRQTGELYKKALTLYAAMPTVVPIKLLSELRLEFENGSRIIIIPDDERTLRGYSAVNLLLLDEAAGIADSTYLSLRPMLAVSRSLGHGGRLVMASTPKGPRGFFHETWTAADQSFLRIHITANDCPRISPEFLASERAILGSLWYQQEYFGRFLQSSEAVFDYESIAGAVNPDLVPLFETPFFRTFRAVKEGDL